MRPELLVIAPERIKRLPVDPERGYPVPFFVGKVDGKWEFRLMVPDKWTECVSKKLCWVCGERLGVHMAFVIGPMCAVNRTTAEPPSHLECAEFSVRACPFLVNPNMRRRENDLPDGRGEMPGLGLLHNPGVILIWVTKSYKVFGDGNGGHLIRLGDPESARFYKEGRLATRSEVDAAIDFGACKLIAAAGMSQSDISKLNDARVKIGPLLPVA